MPFMMGISQLLAPLNEYNLTFPDLTAFIWLACMAKPFIHQCMTDIRHPPIHPPEVVISLLAGALSQDPPTILTCWVAFHQVIWTHGAVLPTDQEIEVFNCHGLVRSIECHTRYYPNYWTNNTDSMHIYYAGVPSLIQAARHFYIEAALMSSMNCARIGQEAYPHACDLCFIVIGDNDSKSKIQVAVCDGNTIGHPYFAVHDCKVPLMTNRHRFCPDHQDLNQWLLKMPTSSMQKLSSSCERGSRGLVLPYSNSTDEDLEVIVDSECDVWATFFGSEAVSAVNLTFKLKEFAKAVFPTAASTPEYFVFDNNCKLRAHQDAIGDDHFAATGMPVDVFHFNSKHKETDTYCQQHCNPAAFPELISGGKWRFNTSICE
ncbi:hypothetical protein CY34DRAFT_110600 [Suillus luteus UH-Slu-Lm8-n1]|uniref:CxC6 like cysteine cluster associated with KDZ domain-containing protein n=1 Tax=Suillus luteus UH-Slu-Lm8-n1 TaxID=930992 RepID=A0A0D0ANK1_9AGAM|nr:hypothetical protein CY34DRAFT_110600 [Suillus luteus UH-Slu-Lm8-n1]